MHRYTRISYRSITCMVVALPLINYVHLGGSVSINIICIWEGSVIITCLVISLSIHAHYLGCYVFALLWCLSLTYGAATEPRASYVLQSYACATRCALISWSVIETPQQSIFRNLRNVLTWVLIWVNRNREYSHDFLTC